MRWSVESQLPCLGRVVSRGAVDRGGCDRLVDSAVLRDVVVVAVLVDHGGCFVIVGLEGGIQGGDRKRDGSCTF